MLDAGQVGHEIVDGLQLLGGRVAQDLLEAAFLRFAGEDERAEIERPLHLRIDLRQHREGAGDMEAADPDGHAELAEDAGQVERAGELVRLHADQHHHSGAGFADIARDLLRPHPAIGLVDGVDVDGDVGAKHALFRAFDGESVEAGERIRRNRRADPLDHVAVVVIVRRLDQDEAEPADNMRGCKHQASLRRCGTGPRCPEAGRHMHGSRWRPIFSTCGASSS